MRFLVIEENEKIYLLMFLSRDDTYENPWYKAEIKFVDENDKDSLLKGGFILNG